MHITCMRKGADMPALQVRDFPDELYVELKACAEREHRSVAQQMIVALTIIRYT